MQPIPEHLEKFDWYAPHQAWLKSCGVFTTHNPGDSTEEKADLRYANLSYADLSYADLSDANLRGAKLRGAVLRGAKGVATRDQSIKRLDEIREHIIDHGDPLDMTNWHGNGWSPEIEPQHACQTSHCLAGWAQALCPDKSMREIDPVTAGVRLIPLAVPLFWTDNETAKNWLENREYAK